LTDDGSTDGTREAAEALDLAGAVCSGDGDV